MIHDDYFKNVTRVLTRFSSDLARWASFWSQVTRFKLEIIKTNILSNIVKCDLWSVNKVFLCLAWWSSFYPKWPYFEADLDIINTNILSKIHDDYFKDVTSGVLTKFFIDLAEFRWDYTCLLSHWSGQQQHLLQQMQALGAQEMQWTQALDYRCTLCQGTACPLDGRPQKEVQAGDGTM